MMQAGWKHRGAFRQGHPLGLIALPDLAIFGVFVNLIAPLVDAMLLVNILTLAYTALNGGSILPDHADEIVAIYRYWATLHHELVPWLDSLARAAYAEAEPTDDGIGGSASARLRPSRHWCFSSSSCNSWPARWWRGSTVVLVLTPGRS